jgi:hypothetical protein
MALAPPEIFLFGVEDELDFYVQFFTLIWNACTDVDHCISLIISTNTAYKTQGNPRSLKQALQLAADPQDPTFQLRSLEVNHRDLPK